MSKLTKLEVLEAVILYQDGLSLEDLAHNYGVTRQAMWSLLKKRTKLRPQIRNGKDNNFYRGGKIKDDQAANITEYAIMRGILKPQPCEICGKTGKMKDGRSMIQAHHDNYKKPLLVKWLCQKHHHEWHKNNKAIRYEKD